MANLGILSTPDEKVKYIEADRLRRWGTQWIWWLPQAAQVVREHRPTSDVAEIL